MSSLDDCRLHFQARRDFLKTLGLAVGGSVFPQWLFAGNVVSRRPNFLFLFADDQRFNTVNALNCPDIITPNLDRLVHNGVTFTHAFIQGSISGAVCICSRAQLITGRSLYHSPLRPKESDGLTLWLEAFRNAGYATFGTGKWHNGPWSYARSFMYGGKIFFGGMSNHLKVPVNDFDPSGNYPSNKRYMGEEFSSNLFSDAAIKFLREYKGVEPFFAYVSYTAPHDPRMAPKKYADMYPPESIPLPKNFMPEHPFDNGEMRIRDERLAPWPRTPEVIRKHIAAYYAMITHLDAQIGRVIRVLEDVGQADNTIIIFSADNGLAVGQHGLMGKQNLYEHSIRVPLIFSGPGMEKRKKIDALVYLHDLFPTTCELAGLKIPKTVESISLVPLLKGEKSKVRNSIFGAYKTVQRMVRNERWKLIRYPYIKKTQLFDIQNDPWETNNLAGDPQYAALINELNVELKRWQRKVGDKLDLDNPPPLHKERGSKWARGSPGAFVKPEKDGSFILRPKDAKTTGRLRYQPDRNNLGAWVNPRDFPEWNLVNVKAGTYKVEFTYGSTNEGVTYTVVVGRQRLTGKTVHTGGLKSYKSFKIGEMKLPAGKVTLAIMPGKFKGAIMNFRLLKLIPITN